MVEIRFYNFVGEKVVINKPLENETISSGLFLQPFNILTPKLKVRFPNVFNFNYCYIPELQRYYFINDVVIVSAGVYELSLNVDVLQTYKTEILNAFGNVVSRENANNYISSRANVFDRKPIFENVEFSEKAPFNESGNIIMITLKGDN